MSIRCVPGDELTAQDVYDIWRIRDAVFAVEQQVDDEDADGLDLLASVSHFWLADADGITSYLRVYSTTAAPAASDASAPAVTNAARACPGRSWPRSTAGGATSRSS